MLPVRRVVTGPNGGVALPARVGRARQHERSLARPQLQQPVARGARHLLPVHVVILGVVTRLSVVREEHVIRHGGRRDIEHRRLVHVIPDAGETGGAKSRDLIGPPRPRARPGEVGEHRGPGPYRTDEQGSIGPVHEDVPRHAVVVHGVAGIPLHARIDDRHGGEPSAIEIGEQLVGSREAVVVPGKDPVFLHVVNVEPHRVGGNAAAAKLPRDCAHRAVGIVAVAALLVPHRPERRQLHVAGEVAVAGQHAGRARAGDDVVVELALLGPEIVVGATLFADVERRSVGVVEKDAVYAPVSQHHEEGDVVVQGIGGVVVAVHVGVPHHERRATQLRAPLVERPGLFAESVEMVVVAQRLPHPHPAAIRRHAVGSVVLVAHLPAIIQETQPKRGAPDFDGEPRGAELVTIGAGCEPRIGGARPALAHRIRVVAAELRGRREPHPNDSGRGNRDAHPALATAILDTVRNRSARRHVAERRPTARRHVPQQGGRAHQRDGRGERSSAAPRRE